MKQMLSFFVAFAVATTSIACTHSASSGLASAPASSSVTASVYHVGQCSFSIGNLFDGSFSDGRESGGYTGLRASNNPVFPVYCHLGISQNDVYDQIGAKPVTGKWIDLAFSEPFKPKQKFKLIEFAGKNWKGIGTAVDQIYYADADRRSRFFNFCLVENDGPQVLCGRTQIRGVTEPDSASTLPKIMAVLKTIDFVNASAPPSTTAKP